MHQHSRKKR